MHLLTRSTWIKIILISALCLVLCGGMLSCSMGISTAGRFAGDISDRIQRSVNFSEHGDFVVPADSIQDLEVIWLAGSVEIEVVDDENAKDDDGNLRITGSETLGNSMRGRFPMTWQIQNGMLEISYGVESGLMSCSNIGEKQLVLTLPRSVARSLKSVDLSGASGTYHLGPIACERMDIDLASGRIEGTDVSAQVLNLDIASGNIELSGDFSQSVDLDMASGNVNLSCPKGCPNRTSLDVASGQVLLSIPSDSDITTYVERLSGSFNCSLPNARTQLSNDTTIFGNGTNTLNAHLASGAINIYPL